MVVWLLMQGGAESIMRNVAKRMLMGEAAQAVICWRSKQLEAKAQARAERIMRRVGGRWRQQDAVEALERWHERAMIAKMQSQGESILKRVGGRLQKKEVAMNFGEWRRNTRAGILDMVSKGWLVGWMDEWCCLRRGCSMGWCVDGAVVLQWEGRVEKLTIERDALQMKFQLTTQA